MSSTAPTSDLPLASYPLTMSTLEIAGLTGKRHNNVLRDTRAVLQELGLPALSFERTYRGEDGKDHPVINLPKRECLILVSGYSVEMRARIIDRWLELEAALAGAGPAPRSPTSPKPFADWTPAETRAACSVVSRYDRAYGPAGARWYMETHGFPIPPTNLFPPLRQRSLFDPLTETRQ